MKTKAAEIILDKREVGFFLKVVFWLVLSSFILAISSSPFAEERPLVLITIKFNLPDFPMRSVNRTIETIRNTIAPRKLVVETLPVNELDEAIQNNKGDIYIIGSVAYWHYLANGLRDIATLVTKEQPDPDHAVGALIVAQEDDDRISSLADLKGKKIGANYPRAFQGWLTLLKEIEDLGFDSQNFFQKVTVISGFWLIVFGLTPVFCLPFIFYSGN